MEYYVGLDVSLKQTSICVVDQTGSVVREGVVDSDPEAISVYVRSKAPDAVLVAGPKADIRGLNAGGCSARTRHPLKRINRGASFIRNSRASSGVLPRPSAAKSQVQQIQASPAMTRCRFASVPLDCA